jgi:hypothetical protein
MMGYGQYHPQSRPQTGPVFDYQMALFSFDKNRGGASARFRSHISVKQGEDAIWQQFQ